MSASEKLKALREWDGLGDPWLSDEGKRALARALPEITALVEAAEESVRVGAHGPLGSALAALEEALS